MSGTEENAEKVGNISPEEHQVTDSKAVQVLTGKEVTTEPVEDQLVEETIRFINETVRETLYKGYLVIGKFLFEKYYDGDIERVRSKNPKKKASLRKLKSHHALPFHPSTLHNMIRVTAQEYFFAEHKIDTSQVDYSHLCELVKLPDDDEKIQLLQRIINEKMYSRELTLLVQEKRKGATGSTTGEPEVILSPSQLFKDLKGLFDNKMTKGLDRKPEELEPEQRNELKARIGETLPKVLEVARIFKRRLREIKTIEAEEKRKK